MSVSTLIGLSGISLLLCVPLLRLLILFNLKKPIVYFLIFIFFLFTFVSIDGNTINQYFRGIFNDLSISSLILVTYYLFTYNHPPLQTDSMLRIIALSGLIIIWHWVLVQLILMHGDISIIFMAILPLFLFLLLLFSLLTYAFYKNDLITLSCLLAASLAFQLNLLESRNLWDYLLDPVIFIVALFSVLISMLRQQKSENTVKPSIL